MLQRQRSGQEKGVIAKGVFSPEESLESLKSLEHGRILLSFPLSGSSLESLNSLESLENGLYSKKTPIPKDPFFRTRREREREREREISMRVLEGALWPTDPRPFCVS